MIKDTIVQKAADNIRVLSLAMVENAKSGHPGGAMGGADYINILFSEFLLFDPSDMSWVNRDRFFLDPGHMSPMLYSIMHFFNVYTLENLKNFRQWKSVTPGHPELDVDRGIENTSGPLGQGHANAVGAAIAEKYLRHRFGPWMEHNIFTYISDGGIQEEISQGAGRIAGHLGLGNLIMFFDSNKIQLSTETGAVTTEDTAAKYRAWGWKVRTIDGHDIARIRSALEEAISEKEKPFLIIGNTVMGKGAITEDQKSFERQVSTHGMPLSKAGGSFEKTVRKLGGDPENAFATFPEVREYYDRIIEEKIAEARRRKEEQKYWEKENPELSTRFKNFMSGKLPDLDFREIQLKGNMATRSASGAVLSYFARKFGNMIVASADLSNSDKTDAFLKNTKPITKNDFSGSFLNIGVSELTMAAIASGLALHGGIIPVCGTFFVFSDFMKPAVRLAALMELPVKYIWTHDAFRVGEDGPTHQPVEQEAQIRLLEQMKNHSGKRSFLALRPADATETVVAWKMALENDATPTALILSRQNITDIPAGTASERYHDALNAYKGAYAVKETEGKPDLVMAGNGSEVSTMLEAAEILEEEQNIRVQVISVISEALFREQNPEYQKSLLPDGVPVLGLTAGLPVTLRGICGDSGMIIGMESFGYSAPYKVLDEKLGFTPAHVSEKATEFLNSRRQ